MATKKKFDIARFTSDATDTAKGKVKTAAGKKAKAEMIKAMNEKKKK